MQYQLGPEACSLGVDSWPTVHNRPKAQDPCSPDQPHTTALGPHKRALQAQGQSEGLKSHKGPQSVGLHPQTATDLQRKGAHTTGRGLVSQSSLVTQRLGQGPCLTGPDLFKEIEPQLFKDFNNCRTQVIPLSALL